MILIFHELNDSVQGQPLRLPVLQQCK